MHIHASMITIGVISTIADIVVIYGRLAQGNQKMRDLAFEITGNGAIIFGVFMLLVGIAAIVYGIMPL